MSSPLADFGPNVRILDDHIREAAASHDEPYSAVLSFAMAHEIGHVLLRSGAHTSREIMAPVGTEYESRETAPRGLLSDDEDAKAIEANLAAPTCPASAAASVFRIQPRSDEGTGRLTGTPAQSGMVRAKAGVPVAKPPTDSTQYFSQ